jgi:hypothetical protein
MDTQNLIIIVAVVVVLAIATAGYFLYQKRQSQRLQQRFGPEYAEAVNRHGSRAKAEAELRRREKRARKFEIVQLTPAEVQRFSQSWMRLQGSFVDDPKGVLIQAEQLVRELMRKRGFPMGDFELRAADLSVDHPSVVSNYRAAQKIVSRDQRGEADTEELRRAVVHFRALFDELLGVPAARTAAEPPTRLAA